MPVSTWDAGWTILEPGSLVAPTDLLGRASKGDHGTGVDRAASSLAVDQIGPVEGLQLAARHDGGQPDGLGDALARGTRVLGDEAGDIPDRSTSEQDAGWWASHTSSSRWRNQSFHPTAGGHGASYV